MNILEADGPFLYLRPQGLALGLLYEQTCGSFNGKGLGDWALLLEGRGGFKVSK
jgi:hypothetical protein